MRAFALDELGEPGSLHDLTPSDPGPGEIRARVHAAGLNAMDVFVVSGMGKGMLQFEYPMIPGLDFSGVVDAVGDGVNLAVGDEVFGVVQRPAFGRGTLADFTVTPAATVTPKPDQLNHATAASLSTAGRTALAVLDAVKPAAGKRVLVVGATGGVGSFATQLLAREGAQVVATVRPENADYARSLGASDVIDYTQGDLLDLVRARYPDGLDAIADFAHQETELTRLAELVRQGGIVVSPLRAANDEALTERGVRAANIAAVGPDRQHEISDLVVRGELRAPRITEFPLDRAGAALVQQASRHVAGKLIVTVA